MYNIELLVIGGGPAGLSAASEATRAGVKTLLIDEAMEPGGLLRIRVCTSDEDAGGRVTQVSFSDTGGGISRADLAKMFDPFFTTKERGTGLGLTIAHTIVEAHQGCIEVESKEGQGSTFRLTFPQRERERERECRC